MGKMWTGIPVTVGFDGIPIGKATVMQEPGKLHVSMEITDPKWIEALSIPDKAKHATFSIAGVSYQNG